MARPKNKKNKQHTAGRVYLVRGWSLPYPLFIFILLAAGVILFGWTAEVTGLNFLVKGKVMAPPLTQPAVIEVPVDQAVLNQTPTNVSGICPPGSYVEIFRNNVFAGTSLCSDNGTFQLAVGLLIGRNSLSARVFNLTDQEGPRSAAISVIYAPAAVAQPKPGGGSSTPPVKSLPANKNYILNTDGRFEYSGYFTGQTVELHLTAGGGVPPYTYDVDWGDHDPRYIIQKDGPFTLSHVYDRAGEFHGSHVIRITGTDKLGKKTFLQLFVIINAKAGVTTSTTSTPVKPVIDQLSRSARWLWVAWPAYGIVLLMSISYVLGEREELFIIRRRAAAQK